MIKFKKTLVLSAVLAVFTSGSLLADEIPAISISALSNANKEVGKAPPIGNRKTNTDDSRVRLTVNNSGDLFVKSGVNQIVPIAYGHTNRIVTPFDNPEVVSSSLSVGGTAPEVSIRDNVVYIATIKEVPLTMFINEKGDQDQSISLTMIPRRIPPKDINIYFDSTSRGGFNSYYKENLVAKKFETSADYVQTLRNLLRTIALGEIPTGYKLQDVSYKDRTPYCKPSKIKVNFKQGQVMRGHNFDVYIGVATNKSNSRVEFDEQSCSNDDVAAVSAYNKVVLNPKDKTEVYVVIRKEQRQKSKVTKRRSLIGLGE